MFQAAATAAGMVAKDSYESMFVQYMTEFNKNYATQDEYMGRLQIFSHNLEKLNEKFSTESTYQMKINEFSDRTPEEMNSMKGFRPTPSFLMAEPTVLDTTNLASSINWVQKGAVTDPKNQGHCGSCWSFSTTGAMEGHHQIVSGDLVSLSEQQLVDCSAMNGGCQGGDMMTAFYYAMDHPLATEESYPYTAVQGTCQERTGVVKVTNTHSVTPKSVEHMKAALNQGPVSVAIEADTTVFQHYASGVLDDAACGTDLDHGVLAVGYGEENGVEYWLVKNSWGSSWGEKGYIKLAINGDGAGTCGILSQPVWPETN